MKVLTVVGARPQFIKAAVVSKALRAAGIEETIVHTGQHYDKNMSEVFFVDMGIPRPDHDLGVGSGSHAYQTGEAMRKLEPVCLEAAPDAVLVYGDTNATLAAGLTAAKLCIPLAHVEAGLRSFDRSMPEEINRVAVDSISDWLFCPTQTAIDNLAAEGSIGAVYNVGDVMYDAALQFGDIAVKKSSILDELGLESGNYVLATIHRDFNTDNREKLAGIVDGLLACDCRVILPAHPRLSKQLEEFGLSERIGNKSNLGIIDPLGYLDMIRLEMSARAIVTDSGGVQKEAFFHGVPCVTVRPNTEWVETVSFGWNRLVPADSKELAAAVAAAKAPAGDKPLFLGDGNAGGKIVEILVEGR